MEVVNALFYITKSGIQWYMLPKEYPKWQLVYYYFRKWTGEGLELKRTSCFLCDDLMQKYIFWGILEKLLRLKSEQKIFPIFQLSLCPKP